MAAALSLGLAGCEFTSPQWTQHSFAPSDGLNANFGDVALRDAFMVTVDGTSASLIVSFVNSANTERTVRMQYTSDTGPTTQKIAVPANGLLSVRPGGAATVTLSGIKTRAGSLFQVYFSAAGKGATVTVPVLTNNLPGYQTLTPPPVVPAPSATITPSPSPGVATPTPTESVTPVP